jgi:type IV secretory pathway TraG/TraD family ATPase VirD4
LGEQTSQLLGQLIVSKIQMAVMSRADTPAYARPPFYLYLDEFQTFTGVAGASYEKLLSRARKYRLGLVLANQQTGQLSTELLHEILGNVSTIVSFNVSHNDAVRLSHEFVSEENGQMTPLNPGELVSLRTGEAYAKIGNNTFFMTTSLFTVPPDILRAKEIIEASRLNYGVKPPEGGSPRNSRTPPPDDDPDPSQVF